MDRQDIDALLIGALYGELTPADEARLATHLESHPTDRGALDDLKVARQAVHDSRIFAVQLDPPQAVSALLLQEAHRRAPKRVVASDAQEGWFSRFARNFMAHPAMAAAAMLVLVMGGAGIVWMKKGDQLADKQYSQSAERVSLEQSAPQGAAPIGGEDRAALVAEGSAYSADLYEGEAKNQDNADEQALDGKSAETASQRWSGDAKSRAREEQGNKQQKAAPSRGMAVTTDRQPKDFDDAKSKSDYGYARDDGDAEAAAPMEKKGKASTGSTTGAAATTPGVGVGGGNANAVSGAGAGVARPSGGDLNGTYAQPPASAAPSAPGRVPGPTTGSSGAAATTTPPPPKTATTTKPTTTADKKAVEKAPAKSVTKSPSPPPPAPTAGKAEMPADSVTASPTAPKPDPAKETKADSALVAWAKGEHTRAVKLAKNGDCGAAAKVALTVSTRASAYYSQYMATDRSLKQCAQYINAERDKEAERSQKARASKRVNADEPAATKSAQ